MKFTLEIAGRRSSVRAFDRFDNRRKAMIVEAHPTSARVCRSLGLAVAISCGALLVSPAQAASSFNFKMVRTQGLPKECAEHATASVHVDTSPGFTERLVITVK